MEREVTAKGMDQRALVGMLGMCKQETRRPQESISLTERVFNSDCRTGGR